LIPVLNIIHLSSLGFHSVKQNDLFLESLRREQNFKSQAYEHKITYGIWEGIIDDELPWRGISKSHKQIIQDAKDNKLPYVTIAEDDFKLKPNGWKIFTNSIPDEFDIFYAGISGGTVNEETKEITGASGMFLYCVHHRFYDAFLLANETVNIDRWLSGLGLEEIEKILGRKPVYKICYPMACITRDGVSYKSGQYVQHDKFFKAYKVLE